MIDTTFVNQARKFCKANSYRLELVGTAGSIVVSRKFKEREYSVARLVKVNSVSKFTLLDNFKQIDTRAWRETGLIR